jgi:hypothetical protein
MITAFPGVETSWLRPCALRAKRIPIRAIRRIRGFRLLRDLRGSVVKSSARPKIPSDNASKIAIMGGKVSGEW